MSQNKRGFPIIITGILITLMVFAYTLFIQSCWGIMPCFVGGVIAAIGVLINRGGDKIP